MNPFRKGILVGAAGMTAALLVFGFGMDAATQPDPAAAYQEARQERCMVLLSADPAGLSQSQRAERLLC